MKPPTEKQSGQSIVLIAFALIALLALVALVVDAGNAYLQQRRVQNAIDAGSQAGSISTATQQNDQTVKATIDQYLNSNGVSTADRSKLTYYYVVQNGTQNIPITSPQIGNWGTGVVVTQAKTSPSSPYYLVVGVQVTGNNSFPTLFGGIVGWSQMAASASSASFGLCGATGAEGLYPIVVSSAVIGTNPIRFNYSYYINENGSNGTSTYYYVTWNSDQSVGTLTDTNMKNALSPDLNQSGIWRTGDSLLPVSPTTSMYTSTNVYNQMVAWMNSGSGITIPVYDTITGGKYHIVGFAHAKLVAVTKGTYSNHNGSIQLQFQPYVDAVGDAPNGGAANYGVCSVKTH